MAGCWPAGQVNRNSERLPRLSGAWLSPRPLSRRGLDPCRPSVISAEGGRNPPRNGTGTGWEGHSCAGCGPGHGGADALCPLVEYSTWTGLRGLGWGESGETGQAEPEMSIASCTPLRNSCPGIYRAPAWRRSRSSRAAPHPASCAHPTAWDVLSAPPDLRTPPRFSNSRVLSWLLSVFCGLSASPSGILLPSGGIWCCLGAGLVVKSWWGRGRAPGMGWVGEGQDAAEIQRSPGWPAAGSGLPQRSVVEAGKACAEDDDGWLAGSRHFS